MDLLDQFKEMIGKINNTDEVFTLMQILSDRGDFLCRQKYQENLLQQVGSIINSSINTVQVQEFLPELKSFDPSTQTFCILNERYVFEMKLHTPDTVPRSAYCVGSIFLYRWDENGERKSLRVWKKSKYPSPTHQGFEVCDKWVPPQRLILFAQFFVEFLLHF